MNPLAPPRHQTQRIELQLTAAQIQELREVLDELPLFTVGKVRGCHELILAILPQLPFESDASGSLTTDADSALRGSDSSTPEPRFHGGGL